MTERLDKFLVSQNIGSRKEIGKLVRCGEVLVNGICVKDAALKINPENDKVVVNGREVIFRKQLYIMMNKPAGVLSATEDKHAATVLDLLPPELYRKGLFPAGRLDKDTTGLLIITDDGDFAHKMLAPKSHVYKLYEVRTKRSVTPEDIVAFETGIRFGSIQFAPARLSVEWRGEDEIALVEIREGKFHQVKRMFEACGNSVVSLRRIKIGGLYLDATLQNGEARLLEKDEIESVFSENIALK